jgi:hypothetical protein
MKRNFNLKFSEAQVTAVFLSAILIMTGAMFSFQLIEYRLQSGQLDKITELASNPQTTLQEQRQLFADVRQVLENQETILERVNNTK